MVIDCIIDVLYELFSIFIYEKNVTSAIMDDRKPICTGLSLKHLSKWELAECDENDDEGNLKVAVFAISRFENKKHSPNLFF